MQSVTIQFDPNQEHQLSAVEIVQNLPPYYSLDSGYMVEGVSADTWEYPAFTVDMETGTGKTYVYLRTIHELRVRYGFRKFIIVVPSLAIYEGVVNTFTTTREHFKGLYGNENVSLIQYDGNVQDFKNFATSSFVEILLITVDSFNRKSNIAFKQTDKLIGERRPYEFIQETRPILILDECQYRRISTSSVNCWLTVSKCFHSSSSTGWRVTATSKASSGAFSRKPTRRTTRKKRKNAPMNSSCSGRKSFYRSKSL